MNENNKIALELVKKLATQALSGEVHLLLACRKISREAAKVQGLPRDITVVFDAISSETDDFPLGEERRYWEPVVLKEKEKEIERYSIEVGPVLREALEKLIAVQSP